MRPLALWRTLAPVHAPPPLAPPLPPPLCLHIYYNVVTLTTSTPKLHSKLHRELLASFADAKGSPYLQHAAHLCLTPTGTHSSRCNAFTKELDLEKA